MNLPMLQTTTRASGGRPRGRRRRHGRDSRSSRRRAAHAAQVVLTEVDVNTDATRATGHNEFLADGVHV